MEKRPAGSMLEEQEQKGNQTERMKAQQMHNKQTEQSTDGIRSSLI